MKNRRLPGGRPVRRRRRVPEWMLELGDMIGSLMLAIATTVIVFGAIGLLLVAFYAATS